MGLLRLLIDLIARLRPLQRNVPSHTKRQAFGPRWSKHPTVSKLRY